MYQRVSIIGYVGRPAESTVSKTGMQITKFVVATNATKEHTEWFNIVAFDKLATTTCSLQTGAKVFCEGVIKTRSWDDKNFEGLKRYQSELILNQFKFLDKKGEALEEKKQEFVETNNLFADDDIPF